MIQPWKKIGSQKLADYRVFSVRSDRKISPRTGKEHDFYVIESVNWVNVVAITPEQQMVMVEQYRHGSNTVELEIPGGMMDPGDLRPEVTGARELREETGYEGENARILGQVYANPAIMNNICFTILIENCRCVHPVEFDHGEDLITKLIPVAEIPHLVAEGKIAHPYVIISLSFFDLWKRGLKKA
jgi:NTP pyrophosphohydrolases including oxidative damage repair enzymes